MKFGVRDICNVVFKAKATTKIGTTTFEKGQPVLYIDSAKTSTLEGAATTVYATGGRGNTRLLAWEGEKTLTFTVEDALLSPVGFAILSGAGLLGGKGATGEVHVHATAVAQAIDGSIDLSASLVGEETICASAPIYVIPMVDDDFAGTPISGTATKGETTITATGASGTVFVDFYVTKTASAVSELQIDAENFAGFYYVEANTLFRRKSDGVDVPAEITLPKVKIQSNFSFAMAATGDPSTFTFTMDAMPDYTMFNHNRKVLCAVQIVDDAIAGASTMESVFPCDENSHAAAEDQEQCKSVIKGGGWYPPPFV